MAVYRFDGFDVPNYTQVPDQFFDELMVNLTEAELRVCLYVMRHTFGWKKASDAISLSQMTDGVRRYDGEVVDRGTGLSRRGVMRGCAGLVEKGVLLVERRRAAQGDNDVNVYHLRFRNEVPRGREHNALPGRESGAPGVGYEMPPQETTSQELDRLWTEVLLRLESGGWPPTAMQLYRATRLVRLDDMAATVATTDRGVLSFLETRDQRPILRHLSELTGRGFATCRYVLATE